MSVLNKCQKQVNIKSIKSVQQIGKAIYDYYQSDCIREYRNIINELYTLFEKDSSGYKITMTKDEEDRLSLMKKINDIVRFNLEQIVNVMRSNPVLKNGLIPDPYIPSVEAEERKEKRQSINSNLKKVDALKILHFKANQIITYFNEKRIINYDFQNLEPEKKTMKDFVKSIGRTNYGGIRRTKCSKMKMRKTRKIRRKH